MLKLFLLCSLLALAAPVTALACPHASADHALSQSAQHDHHASADDHAACADHATRQAFEAKGFSQPEPQKARAHKHAHGKHAHDNMSDADPISGLNHADCPHHKAVAAQHCSECDKCQDCDQACHDQADCQECAEHCEAHQH